ncbi:hypothetical protein SLS62_011037 [Diatrype stigma]|uniref:Uncharacterized protein n=1 Tax=Diatrype stigma TaxID=117547 RepID=A0AAN9YG98_9PEZI
MSHGLAMVRQAQASWPLAQDVEAKKDELVELVKELNVLTAQGSHPTNLKTTMKWVDIQEKTFEIDAIQHGLLASSGMEFCPNCDLSSPKTVQAIQNDLRSRLSRYENFAAETKMIRNGIDKLREKLSWQVETGPSLQPHNGAWPCFDKNDGKAALRTPQTHLDGGDGWHGWGNRSRTQPSSITETKNEHTHRHDNGDWDSQVPAPGVGLRTPANNNRPQRPVKDYHVSQDVQGREYLDTPHSQKDTFWDREDMSGNKDMSPYNADPSPNWRPRDHYKAANNKVYQDQSMSGEALNKDTWTEKSWNDAVWVDPVSFIDGAVITNSSNDVKVLTPSASTRSSKSSSTTDPFVDTMIYNPKYPLRTTAREPKDKRTEDELLAQFPWMKRTDLHTFWERGEKSTKDQGRASSLFQRVTEMHQNETLD